MAGQWRRSGAGIHSINLEQEEHMSGTGDSVNRRDFIRSAAAVTAALGIAGRTGISAQRAGVSRRVVGANDQINLGIIGVGGRGTSVGRAFASAGAEQNLCRVVAVCDVYQKRIDQNKEIHKCDGYLDYRELLARKDIDAVIIATPDHQHAHMAIEAMDAGIDVYVEKPMCHTIPETRRMIDKVKQTGRVLMVGSQTTSADQWHKAKKAIADGAIGQMIMSQGSYHRNSRDGEWNYRIDPEAGPEKKGADYIDWKGVARPGANRARTTRTGSSGSASTGTTPAGPPPTSSSTSPRRSTSAGRSRSTPTGSWPGAATSSSRTGATSPTRST